MPPLPPFEFHPRSGPNQYFFRMGICIFWQKWRILGSMQG